LHLSSRYKDPVQLYIISYISDKLFSELQHLASYVSRHYAIAHDAATTTATATTPTTAIITTPATTTGGSQNAIYPACGIMHMNLSTFATGLEDTRHRKQRLCEVGSEVK
jgi:hypothetical protein